MEFFTNLIQRLRGFGAAPPSNPSRRPESPFRIPAPIARETERLGVATGDVERPSLWVIPLMWLGLVGATIAARNLHAEPDLPSRSLRAGEPSPVIVETPRFDWTRAYVDGVRQESLASPTDERSATKASERPLGAASMTPSIATSTMTLSTMTLTSSATRIATERAAASARAPTSARTAAPKSAPTTSARAKPRP